MAKRSLVRVSGCVRFQKRLTRLGLQDALAKEREENARLRKQLEQARTDRESAIVTDTPEMIPRPRGTAGNDYSTEVEMQLGDTADNHDAFKGIQVRHCPQFVPITDLALVKRTLRDLVLQARINWEVQWSEVPAASKAQLYAVVSAIIFNTLLCGCSFI